VHEYSLLQALIRRVEEEAHRHHASSVRGLKVSMGEFSGVEPRLFESAYELIRTGTICEGASLEIVRYPGRFSCPGCGKDFANGEVLHCATCDRPAQMDERSESLNLESIDMEIP